MRSILVCSLLLAFVVGMGAVRVQAQTSRDIKENEVGQLINGYHPSEFYYNTVQIPEEVEASTGKEDQINVALHYKIVAFEKEARRPINSLPKNDLEAKLAQLREEAVQELGFAAPAPQPAQETPAEKPAIILPEGEER